MSDPELLIKYQNQWVALTSDRSKVVDSAKDFEILANKVKKLRKKDIIISYVLPMDSYYSPLCSL